jgi:hypothetical protein
MSPIQRRLIIAWATLMGLTLAIGLAGDVTRASRLGWVGLVAIALVTVAKTRLVLADYLGLRRNPGALVGMTAAIALTLAVVVGAFIAIPG